MSQRLVVHKTRSSLITNGIDVHTWKMKRNQAQGLRGGARKKRNLSVWLQGDVYLFADLFFSHLQISSEEPPLSKRFCGPIGHESNGGLAQRRLRMKRSEGGTVDESHPLLYLD